MRVAYIQHIQRLPILFVLSCELPGNRFISVFAFALLLPIRFPRMFSQEAVNARVSFCDSLPAEVRCSYMHRRGVSVALVVL